MTPSGDIFDREATRYDAWFETPDGRLLFENELAAVRSLWREEFRPALEVGVGTGRFASALGIEHGVDSATGALRLAAARGIHVVCGRGEALPFADACFGAVFLIATLCFAEEPRAIFREAARVLRPNGRILVGEIPSESAWGRRYARKREEGHPFYRHATFHSIGEIRTMLAEVYFEVAAAASTLATPPDRDPSIESPRLGIDETCGFVCLLAERSIDAGSTTEAAETDAVVRRR